MATYLVCYQYWWVDKFKPGNSYHEMESVSRQRIEEIRAELKKRFYGFEVVFTSITRLDD